MAKLGLLVIAVFCVVQISLAARLPRDAPVEPSTSSLDKLKDSTVEGFQKIRAEVEKTLTKENLNTVWDNIQAGFGEASKKFSEISTDISKSVQSSIADLNKETEKKD